MSILVQDVMEDLAVLPQIAPSDPRFYRYLNAAQRQIFLSGNYVGVVASYNFLLYTSILTLPYECEALLQADIWGVPIYVQNQWFEFLQCGPGYQGLKGNQPKYNVTFPDFFDRGGGWPVIQDPPGPFTIQIFCAVPEDPNAVIIIEGLDQNGLQIRSSIPVQNGDGTISATWINGTQSPLYNAALPFIETTQLFTKVTAITLPCRNGDLRLLANMSGTTFLLGIYPYFMTNPGFRRYSFPAYVENAVSGNPPVPVNALVRRKPLPIKSPLDRLTVENIEALKMYFQAAWKDEEESYSVADDLRARGNRYLEQEVRRSGSSMDRLNVNLRGFSLFPRLPGSL